MLEVVLLGARFCPDNVKGICFKIEYCKIDSVRFCPGQCGRLSIPFVFTMANILCVFSNWPCYAFPDNQFCGNRNM